jgi:3-hydroxyisobutyrate dehydrogenase-like beta-hydroxyacid dehydrogenase
VRSVSPAVKQTIGKIVASSGARFVEVAVMAPLAPHAHRVPMLAGGPAAKAFADAMTPLGMRVDVLDGAIGGAAAVEMCRSIVVKGL